MWTYEDDESAAADCAAQMMTAARRQVGKSNMRTYVWLAEKSCNGPAEKFGVFSTPEKAKEVCQDESYEYLGARYTPQLKWTGNERHSSASYYHPSAGIYVFLITRFEVDKVQAM